MVIKKNKKLEPHEAFRLSQGYGWVGKGCAGGVQSPHLEKMLLPVENLELVKQANSCVWLHWADGITCGVLCEQIFHGLVCLGFFGKDIGCLLLIQFELEILSRN